MAKVVDMKGECTIGMKKGDEFELAFTGAESSAVISITIFLTGSFYCNWVENHLLR